METLPRTITSDDDQIVPSPPPKHQASRVSRAISPPHDPQRAADFSLCSSPFQHVDPSISATLTQVSRHILPELPASRVHQSVVALLEARGLLSRATRWFGCRLTERGGDVLA